MKNLIKWVMCIVALLFMGFKNAYSQASQVRETGRIIDVQTKQPVEGVTVICYPGLETTITDVQGTFAFTKGNTGVDSFKVSMVGYELKKVSYGQFIKDDHRIFLSAHVVEMGSVTVTHKPNEQYNLISRLDIRMRDVNNSQEVLRLVPGLFIGQHAGGGKAEQIFLRGFDIDHGTDVNISVDGMPVNMVSHAHGQGYADLHFLIPELIEKVSFRKGPYYAEKGNLNTAGFVDFRTRNSLPRNMIKAEGGQFNTWRGVGAFNLLSDAQRQKGQNAFIASEYMYTRGYFDHPQNFHRLNVFGKYHGRVSRTSELDFSASIFSSEWKASGQIPERAMHGGLIGFFGAIDPNEGGNTGRTNLNARLLTTLNNGDLVKNQVYFTRYDFELYSNFTFFLNNDIDGDQIRQKEKRNLFGYNGSYTRTSYIGNQKLETEAGLGFRFDKTKDSELSRTRDRVHTLDRIKLGDINELNSGIWINETIEWTPRFTMNAGIRWDHFNALYRDKLDNGKKLRADAGILSPKLNFYYQLSDKTQLYLTSGKGFHSNDTRVMVETGGKDILPAAYGTDLGVVLKPAPELLLQGAAWYLHLDQEFVYVGDEGVVEPGGRSRRMGLDLSARYQPVKWLYIDVDANYSHGRAIDEAKGEDRLPLAPVFTSIGGISYHGSQGIRAGLRYRFMGDRPANEDNSTVAKGYFITDAVMSYERKRFEIGVSVQNLFDVRWKETQFDTESKLKHETDPVSEIHFTPGSPFFLKGHVVFYF